jgi:hypothetical protein
MQFGQARTKAAPHEKLIGLARILYGRSDMPLDGLELVSERLVCGPIPHPELLALRLGPHEAIAIMRRFRLFRELTVRMLTNDR